MIRELAAQIADQFRVFGHGFLRDAVIIGGMGEFSRRTAELAQTIPPYKPHCGSKHVFPNRERFLSGAVLGC
jgi:hypothetical protein